MDKRFFAGQNLVDVFNNMVVTPWIEMEIETAGLSDSDTHVIF